MKETYIAPTIDIIEIAVEKGFANSHGHGGGHGGGHGHHDEFEDFE